VPSPLQGSELPGASIDSPTSSDVGGAVEDEVRPVTVLFADVVGSTALGERLRPDETKSLIGEIVTRMSRVVEEFGGRVQAYMGDGICVFFGIPKSHGDETVRAARSALRIIEVSRTYADDIKAAWGISGFAVRVGLNSGLTAVGLVGGNEPASTAMGDTTNVAARLQGEAVPGTILVGDSAARLLQGGFHLTKVGKVAVKGRSDSVVAWRLTDVRREPAAIAVTPMVGRAAELAQLAEIADGIRAGRGGALLLVGDAGIGKTRLLEELRQLVGDEAQWLQGHCLSYESNAPYFPIGEIIRGWLDVNEGDPEISVRTKLLSRLGDVFEPSSSPLIAQMAQLLGIAPDAVSERWLTSPGAESLGGQTSDAVLAWLRHLAERSPVVVAIEDIHWSDQSTRDLLEDVLEATDNCPLLAVMSLRVEPQSRVLDFWAHVLSDYAHRATEIRVKPLSEEEAREMARSVGNQKLQRYAEDQIVERAEGNPFFIEELTRTLIDAETRDDRTSSSWTLAGSFSDLPDTIDGLLLARLDGLPPEARAVIQMAAAIGRRFSDPLLRRALGRSNIDAELAVLLRSNIIGEVHRYPELQYTFRHGLIQEAALAMLTPPRARRRYFRVAHAFEELYGASDENVQLLAYYYYRSDNPQKALHFLRLAAERAERLDSRPDADRLWRRALKVATTLADEAAVDEIQDRLQESSASAQ
jgi:class 3 adenylate cyclase